jgi:hypothetical protein
VTAPARAAPSVTAATVTAWPGLQVIPGRPGRGIIYLLHFDQLYVPYPGAAPVACAGHYTGTSESSRFLNGGGPSCAGASRRCPLCGVKPRPGALPCNINGSVSRSLVTDLELAAAGLMTSAARAAHAELRRGAAAGKVAALVRLPVVPADDPWYAAPAGGAL